jgi:tetratricopeptide (TPR) repeat protein
MPSKPAPRSLFEDILSRLKAGQLKEALALSEEVLKDFPGDINVLGLKGVALADLGDLIGAEKVLREVIELAPTFAKPYEDLGTLLLKQGKAEEAVPLLEKATRLDPSLEAAHFQLGRAYARLGDGKKADTAYEKSFELSPVRGLMAQAAEHHKAGRFQEAERLCRQVLQKERGNVDALRMLGLLAGAAGQLDEAAHLLKQALSHAPDHAAAMFELGRVLKDLERHEEAIEVYQRLVDLQPDNAKAHYRLGAALAPAALTERAAASYQRCLDLAPNHTGAWLGMGHMLKTLGRQDEGIAAYQRCRELEPSFGEAFYSLANLKTYKFDEDEIAHMQAQLEDPELKEASRVNFLFSLGKAFENRKDYATAWRYYDEGNAAQRMLVSYDPVLTETTNDDLVAFFSAEFFRNLGEVGNPDASPIFVLGMPRSGSTLVEQIIASHSQVEGTSELPYLGRLTKSLNANRADGMKYPQVLSELEGRHFERLGSQYLELAQLHRVEGAPHFIDKMPNNFPLAGFIHCILPNAKIIDARRHPLDACVGNLKQLYARGQNFTYDQTDLGEYYLQYQRMMDHWDAVLPGKVLRVQYEETVGNLEQQVQRILDYLELPWEDACVNFHETERAVRTASSEQVRQPIYTSGVGFWKNWDSELEELKMVLEPILGEYESLGS